MFSFPATVGAIRGHYCTCGYKASYSQSFLYFPPTSPRAADMYPLSLAESNHSQMREKERMWPQAEACALGCLAAYFREVSRDCASIVVGGC